MSRMHTTHSGTLQELAFSSVYWITALLAVLERKGILALAQMLDQIKRLKGTHPHGQ